MQLNKLYVGNLPYGITQDDLQELFDPYGQVVEITLIDGRGFAFVEMSSQVEAEAARKELNYSELRGRELKINIARPQESRGRRRR